MRSSASRSAAREARYCRSCSSVGPPARTRRDRRARAARRRVREQRDERRRTAPRAPWRAPDRRRASRRRRRRRAAATIFPRVAGPTPGRSCSTRKPATRSRGFSTKRSAPSASLTCAASRNFRPPNLTNGMLRRVSSSSSAAEWLPVRNSTACDLRARPRFAIREHALGDVARLVGLLADVDDQRRRAAGLSVHSVFGKRSGLSAMTAFDAARIGAVER